MTERASIERTLEFCNEVREAGGGTPLDALIPATPEDSSQCLIAQGVNFHSEVNKGNSWKANGEKVYSWFMSTDDEDIAMKIGEKLGLDVCYNYDPAQHDAQYNIGERYVVVLPDDIGQVAAAFDDWSEAIQYVDGEYNAVTEKWEPGSYKISPFATETQIKNLKDFWPYVEESMKESYENATFVNDKGEIII